MAKGRRDGQEAERVFARQLGGRLAALRDRLGWTQQETSEKIQLSIEAYGRLERGVSIPTADTLDRVCRGMNVTPNELLGWEESPASDLVDVSSAPEEVRDSIRHIVVRLRDLTPEGIAFIETATQFASKVRGDR